MSSIRSVNGQYKPNSLAHRGGAARRKTGVTTRSTPGLGVGLLRRSPQPTRAAPAWPRHAAVRPGVRQAQLLLTAREPIGSVR